jgi:protein tyrosine/serine phosphatase
VINLADASNTYEGSADAYYQTCQVTYLNLGTDFLSEDAMENLARGMRFIIDNEAPYLLHCNEGKDRAGFVSALLECLMGATIDEVVEDYMETYINYYGVEKGSQKYEAVATSNLIPTLNANFKVNNVYQADLVAEAEEFLMQELGLSADEVTALKQKLGSGN